MSVFLIQLTVILVGIFQEVEGDTAAVWLACSVAIYLFGHWDIGKHVTNQGVAIHHVLSDDQVECCETVAANARARDEWSNESSGYEEWDEGTKQNLETCPNELKFHEKWRDLFHNDHHHAWIGLYKLSYDFLSDSASISFD